VILNTKLKEAYLREHPIEAAASLERLAGSDAAEQLAGVAPELLAAPFELLTQGRVTAIFPQLEARQQEGLLSKGSPRLALILLNSLDDEKRQDLLERLPASVRDDLQRLQRFDPESAGSLMDRPSTTYRTGMTVDETKAMLREARSQRQRAIYVVDNGNRLIGKVGMQTLALASGAERLQDILEPLEGKVLPTAPRKELVEQLEMYQVDSLPVVDVEDRLLGIVRYQRLFRVIESEASADMQKMVGASVDERALSTAMFSVKRRLPWLHINLLTAFLAAAVVGLFESLIAQFTALAVLLPVVAGQSGNAGSQALAVTMRGLALREIGIREWRLVLWKEIQVGFIDGSALAVTCGIAVFLWSQSFGLAIVIAVAMILSMIAAGISGAVVPILLIRFGQDPATASSIVLTTVTDVAGFFSFLGTATALSFML
jgi:magnesium transporter